MQAPLREQTHISYLPYIHVQLLLLDLGQQVLLDLLLAIYHPYLQQVLVHFPFPNT